MNIKHLLFTAIYFSLLSLYANAAVPGDLDPTFGSGGKVVDATFGDRARGVAIQSDGKIVVVSEWSGPVFEDGFVLVRLHPNGSLDTTFGVGGRVFHSPWFKPQSIAIQPDGKIVIAGNSAPPGGGGGGVLVRYNPSGSIDSTFGTDGHVAAGLLPTSVAIQTNGRVVVGGSTSNGFAIGRYNPNGSGVDILTTPGSGTAYSVAIQPDGRIVAGGGFAGDGEYFSLVRYNPDGSLDTTFGGDGRVTTFVQYGAAYSLAIQPDGKIVAAGYSCFSCGEPGWGAFSVIRYNTDGSLDTTFDSDGIVETVISGIDIAYSVAVQADAKIVAAGSCYGCQTWDFAIVRYNPNGSLDNTFGAGNGIKTVDFSYTYDEGLGMAIDDQGRAIIVGFSYLDLSTAVPAIARILLTPEAPFDFDGDGRSDVSVFRPSDAVWYLDRSTQGFSATPFGVSADKVVPADYDGDGKTDIAVFRDGMWWRINSGNSTVVAAQFGIAGDIPVPADYTGDGRDEIAVYRNGQWWSLDLSNGQVSLINFGLATDKPVPADYDGDGRVDQAVYRDGVWHLNRSTLGYTAVQFGLPNDKPVVGDYDGDSKADLAVYRGGTWYLLQSTAGSAAFSWGLPTDTPAPADYDGDGKTDPAVYRNGTWYQLNSTGGTAIRQFGLPGDAPLPSSFLR